MKRAIVGRAVALAICGIFAGGMAPGETKDLGGGFLDHGKAAPKEEDSFYLLQIVAGPSGTICGSKPARPTSFVYHPKTDTWEHYESGGHGILALNKQGTRLYIAGEPYGRGALSEWDPLQPQLQVGAYEEGSNPCILAKYTSNTSEYTGLLVLPDGENVVMAARPNLVKEGAELLFWDSKAKVPMLVGLGNALSGQWPVSFAALPEGKLLGGTGTDRYDSAHPQPELFIMDVTTKAMDWHQPLFPDLTEYSSLCAAANGLVYGIARVSYKQTKGTMIEGRDPKRLFVFDPVSRRVVYQNDWDTVEHPPEAEVNTSLGGPIAFVPGEGSDIFVLFRYWIAKIDLATHALLLVAHSPVKIGVDGAYLDGRIYFGDRQNLYSYEVAVAAK